MTEEILSDVKVWHLITRRLNCNEGELSVTLGHQPGAKLQNTTFCFFFSVTNWFTNKLLVLPSSNHLQFSRIRNL